MGFRFSVPKLTPRVKTLIYHKNEKKNAKTPKLSSQILSYARYRQRTMTISAVKVSNPKSPTVCPLLFILDKGSLSFLL